MTQARTQRRQSKHQGVSVCVKEAEPVYRAHLLLLLRSFASELPTLEIYQFSG